MISNKKILILGNSHLSVFGFRGELVEKLVEYRNEVVVVFPNGPFGKGEEASREYGCHFIEIDIDRRGTNPVQDIKLLFKYIAVLQKVKPDAVLAYTVKCDIYGGIACRLLGIPFYPNITGLGKGLAEKGTTQKITILLYKLAVKNAACVFFQNHSDRQFFTEHKIVFKKSAMLPGSGVNLEKFIPQPYSDDNRIFFTYIARVMKAKGIDQFLEAAERIKDRIENVEFHVCGYCEEDYKQVIAEAEKKGIITYHGLVTNIKEYIKRAHCIVLPTFHPEGISNTLLEAAACARPIITTNRAGCREVVEDHVNGFLVRERDTEDLIDKIEKFILLTNDQRIEMGNRGRIKVEKEFDREIVIKAYMDEIKTIIG